MRFKAMLTVTEEGVVTGDYWKALEEFEFRKAEERAKAQEQQRLDDLERAYATSGAVKPMRKKNKKSPSTAKTKKKIPATYMGQRNRMYPTHGIQVG